MDTYFDAAASKAEQELEQMSSNPQVAEAVKVVGAWWNKWYMKAGHKRLARILLVQAAKLRRG